MLIPPDRLDEFPQTLTAVKRGDSLANYETIRLRKDGETNQRLADRFADPRRERADHRPVVDRARHHRAQAARGGAAAIAEDGRRGPAGRRHRARFQQHPHRDPRLQRSASSARSTSGSGCTSTSREIRKAADFAASLTHQLLAFSRRQPLFLRVFNINDSVKKHAEDARSA